jgi:hypothetical protein
MATWGASDRVYARAFGAGGSWGPKVELGDWTHPAHGPRMAMNGAGQGFAAWVEDLPGPVAQVGVRVYSPP